MRPETEAEDTAAFTRIAPQRPAPSSAASPPAADAAFANHGRVRADRVVLAFLLLLLLGGLLLWALPRWLGVHPTPERPPSVTADAAELEEEILEEELPSIDIVPVDPGALPGGLAAEAWDDPALLQARAAAQMARTRYQTGRAALGAGDGADAELGAAERDAERGAQAFDARDYATAQQAFEAAAAATGALLEARPQRLQTMLEAGRQALERNDPAAAIQAFEQALRLDPGNADAQRGLLRASSHDTLRDKLDEAFRLERDQRLDEALRVLRDAVKLDGESAVARDALARLETARADAAFNRHLGQALSALDGTQLDAAKRALEAAGRLKSRDAALTDAQTRLAGALRAAEIRTLQTEAQVQAAREAWAGAVANYERALALDASLVFAADGLAQARPRAELDAQLQRLLDAPDRLHSAAVLAEAETALARAKQVASTGPRLQGQIETLERTIAAASTPIEVTLQSDGQTEVTLYRVGALGRFQQHRATLKPGRYVAVGTRAGYIDVRREFEVRPGASAIVDVRCTEAL